MPPDGSLMDRVPKPFLFITVGVILLGLAAIMAGQMQRVKQLNAELAQKQQLISEKETENEQLTQENATLQAEKKALDEQRATLRTQLSSVSTDLENKRAEVDELKTKYDTLTEERTRLQAQVATVTSERDEAKKRLQNLEADNTNLERTASRMRERLALLDRDYREVVRKLSDLQAAQNTSLLDGTASSYPPVSSTLSTPSAQLRQQGMNPSLSGTVELPPIIVQRDQADTPAVVRARILEVNSPHNFVVVDKGSLDGVRLGMVFDILRGGGMVGRATVVRVRPQLAACDIIRANTPSLLQVGDLAIQSVQ